MDCGVPFCHTGCPLNNIIPDWNDLVYRDRWQEAIRALHATNNFPEFTGRICPAPCEAACVLGHQRAAGDHQADREHRSSSTRSTKAGSARNRRARARASASPWSGSGPAGLAAAQQLNRAGHYGHACSKRPTASAACSATAFPISRWRSTFIDRRIEQMAAEGVEFRHQRACRRQRPGDAACARSSMPSCSPAAPSSPRDLNVPGPRAQGHSLRHGVPAAAEPALRGRPRRSEGSDSRDGQARGHHRRRRHGRGLPRHLPPSESRSRSTSSKSCRCRPSSARRRRPGRSGRCSCGWKARTKKAASASGPSPPRSSPATPSGNVTQLHADPRRPAAEVRADARDRVHARSRPGPAGHGLHRPGQRRDDRASWACSSTRAATLPPTQPT